MKKFFGIILLVVGILWTLVFLMTFNASDGYFIFASSFLTAIGVFFILLGIRLMKGKKSNQSVPINNQQYTPPQANAPVNQPTQQPVINNEHLSLNDIRALTDKKIADIPFSQGKANISQLIEAYFGMNDKHIPFEFQSSQQNGVDMIAHWKLADADYLGILGLNKNKIQSQFDVLMKFDDVNGVVRCKDKVYQKQSSFGIGGMGMEMSSFSGKSTSMKKEIVIGRKKDGSIGKVVDYSLDTTILQNAIKEIAEKHGWKVKRVAGKL